VVPTNKRLKQQQRTIQRPVSYKRGFGLEEKGRTEEQNASKNIYNKWKRLSLPHRERFAWHDKE
jgi:hypothetical protein